MRRFIEIMWIAIAAFSAIEMIVGYRQSGVESRHFQTSGLVFLVAFFMYFIRKRQRKNIDNHKNR